MNQTYQYQNKSFTLDLTGSGKSYRATLGDKIVDVQVLRVEDGRLDLVIDGSPLSAIVSVDGARRWVTVNGQTLVLSKVGRVRKGVGHDEHSAGQLLSPMPGQVRAVQTAIGELVTRGQTLLVVEAMKMEIKVSAPFDGRVKTLPVKLGQTVDKEQLLIEIEP